MLDNRSQEQSARSASRRLRRAIAITFVLSSCVASWSQSSTEPPDPNTRIFGTLDKDVVVPVVTLPLGHVDAAANQAVNAYLKLLTFTTAGTALQASGTLTDVLGSNPATLTFQQGTQLRMDVSLPAGQRSVRVNGAIGSILESNSQRHSLPPATSSIGLMNVGFALPQLLASGPYSLVDDGMVTLANRSLHRVTLSLSVQSGSSPSITDKVAAVDLYFDSNTGLLAKSATFLQIDSADRASYLQVVTYDSYGILSQAALPSSISVTLNGQPQWQLQLSSVQLTPQVNDTYFRF